MKLDKKTVVIIVILSIIPLLAYNIPRESFSTISFPTITTTKVTNDTTSVVKAAGNALLSPRTLIDSVNQSDSVHRLFGGMESMTDIMGPTLITILMAAVILATFLHVSSRMGDD